MRVWNRRLETICPPHPFLPRDLFLSPVERHKIVLRLSKRKAPGPDDISTAALRQLPKRAMVAMNEVFDGILRTGHFPEPWKRGKVITVPKLGKYSRNPCNLRPITLLSSVAKTLERALLWRLNPFLSPRKKQYGFRARHSTTLQLIRGSCLSPSLFAAFTDDIPTLQSLLEEWEEHDANAEDSANFASARRANLAAKKIQRFLDLLLEWLDRWMMYVGETAALVTSKQRNMSPYTNYA
ncbi:Probable RNA-directed DNA polymerase from transposon X-element [Eumeta japonica]|uniref:Probable RNA-directed DNA polymerase from transposon X-element n=1 Tax=Eumeta variegata TaxID=151549 RepID=A0A4C1TI75_EUMVA|nr:Probable RNA-directed DNA polymerase from transposon X-element [Eumeta japonica]